MPQLKTHIEISALMRRAQSAGAFAAVLRKGDMSAGAYLVITRQASGTIGQSSYTLYRPMRNMEGERVWWPKGPLDQAAVDLYVNRRIDEDPDLWVIEIDDAQGRHFLTDTVEENVREEDAAKPKDSDDDRALKAAIKAVFPDR